MRAALITLAAMESASYAIPPLTCSSRIIPPASAVAFPTVWTVRISILARNVLSLTT